MFLPDAMFAELEQGGLNLIKCKCTGELSQAAGVIEALVEVEQAERNLWVDVCPAMGGAGGGLVRLPKAGETGVMAAPEGKLSDGFLVAWVHTAAGMPAPEVPENTYMLQAADSEHVLVRATGEGTIRLEGPSGIFVELTAAGKVKVGNGEVELLDLLHQTLTTLQSTVVLTQLGTQPLSSAANFGTLATLLDQIKA